MIVRPHFDDVAAAIRDAYYEARDNGGNMHTASEDAARRVLSMVDGEAKNSHEAAAFARTAQ